METVTNYPNYQEITDRQKYYRKAKVKEQIIVSVMLICTILMGAFMYTIFANF